MGDVLQTINPTFEKDVCENEIVCCDSPPLKKVRDVSVAAQAQNSADKTREERKADATGAVTFLAKSSASESVTESSVAMFSTSELQQISSMLTRLLAYEQSNDSLKIIPSGCVDKRLEQLEVTTIRQLLSRIHSPNDAILTEDGKQPTMVSKPKSKSIRPRFSQTLTSGFEYTMEAEAKSKYDCNTERFNDSKEQGRAFKTVKEEVVQDKANETEIRQQMWKNSDTEVDSLFVMFSDLGPYQLSDGSADDANRCFEESMLFAPELMFLLTLSSMYTPTTANFFLEKVWPRFVISAFICCIGVCSFRLFGHELYGKGPAFYNSYTNGVFVIVHLWLPGAFITMRNLINAPFLLEALREFSQIEPLRRRIFFFSRVTGVVGLGLTATICIWVVLGWIIDFLDPYYMHSKDPIQFWFGLLSAFSFFVIVVPWVASLLAVYSMFHTVLAMLTLHVEELVYTLDQALDAMYTDEDRKIAQAKRRVTRAFYGCFQGITPMTTKKAMKQMMNHFNARSDTMAGRWSLRHRKTDLKLDVMPFKMKVWKLRTLVSLISKRVNFMLVSLICVSLALVLAPGYVVLQDVRNEDIPDWKHLFRDGFCVTVGMLALYLALWETSAFTETCSMAGTVINEMDFPDADDRTMVMGYFTSGDTKLGFQIAGILITKSVFLNFVLVSIAGIIYLVVEISV